MRRTLRQVGNPQALKPKIHPAGDFGTGQAAKMETGGDVGAHRLVQQQPWQAAAGIDQVLGARAGGWPLTVGASLAVTPGYRTQQTPEQAVTAARLRSLDVYALWTVDRQTTLRLGGANLLADGTRSLTELQPANGGPWQTQFTERAKRRSVNLGLAMKF